MHAALDAVDEQLCSTSTMHLARCMAVVDRFNILQAKPGRRLRQHQINPFLSSEPIIVVLVAVCSYIHHCVVPPACAHMVSMPSATCIACNHCCTWCKPHAAHVRTCAAKHHIPLISPLETVSSHTPRNSVTQLSIQPVLKYISMFKCQRM